MDFTVYANYDRETETGEIEHIEGEASYIIMSLLLKQMTVN